MSAVYPPAKLSSAKGKESFYSKVSALCCGGVPGRLQQLLFISDPLSRGKTTGKTKPTPP